MKKLILSILLLFSIFGVAQTYAEGGGSSDLKVTDKIVYLKTRVTPIRPNAPSTVYIPCMYDEGFVLLDFPEGIRYGTVRIFSVLDPDDEWFGFASVDEPALIIPSFIGDYKIECVVDDGRIFEEILHFDSH